MEAKACRTVLADALQQREILQLVLSFVGGKEYFFMSLVNSIWTAVYCTTALKLPCKQ
jgi:hypothetical protein